MFIYSYLYCCIRIVMLCEISHKPDKKADNTETPKNVSKSEGKREERGRFYKYVLVWIPKELVKRLKVKGAETDKSLKEMMIDALNRFV